MRQKRKPIRKDEYLAAALACLLPQEQRDELRRARVPAQDVIRLFSPDHIGLQRHFPYWQIPFVNLIDTISIAILRTNLN